MSLLWKTAVQHEAMPWHQERDGRFKTTVAHPVKKAGFAGFVGNEDHLREEHEDRMNRLDEEHGDDHFDDDAYSDSSPDPTPEEAAHYEEHGEYPESFDERHYSAYEKAKEENRKIKDEDLPDIHDPTLRRFVNNRGGDTDFWMQHGERKPISLKGPVHATQSHVSQTHIDRYLNNPTDKTDRQHGMGTWQAGRYLGDEGPMFVTHQGRLHATEGHHRVAAALARGDHSILGWHYDLDKDPGGHIGSDEDHDDDDDWGGYS